MKPRKNLETQKKKSKLRYIFLLFFILIFCGIFSFIYFFITSFDKEGPLLEKKIITISPNESLKKIASNLKNENIIFSKTIFIYNAKIRNFASRLKAGEYEIPKHASIKQILEKLTKGKSLEYSFTVPEGITLCQVFKRLRENNLLEGPLPETLPPEGSLIADTILFTRGTQRQKIVDYLQKRQEKLIDEIWQNRDADLFIKSKKDLVILASIVEKETGIPSERRTIASVFYNRLQKNMRLQSDPTVLYGLFGGEGKPSGRAIYRSDLQKETPYNTYKIKGLPPTPIAIPGKASLEAVAHPEKTSFYYFVANGTGGHVFSNSLKEHIKRVQEWRLIKQKNNK